MPVDVTTARTRDVTWTSDGVFGYDWHTGFAPGGTGVQWWLSNPISHVWGTDVWAFVFDFDPSAAGDLLGTDPGVQPANTKAVWLLIVRGAARKVTKFYISYTPGTGPYALASGSGSWSHSEDSHHVQHFGSTAVSDVQPYEVGAVTDYTISASSAVGILDVGAQSIAGTGTVSDSFTLADAVAGGISSGAYSGRGYTMEFNGIAVAFDASITVSFSDSSFNSLETGINTNMGKVQLTGTGLSLAFHWTGVYSDVNTFLGGTPGTQHIPKMTMTFEPSFAMEVDATVSHYGDFTGTGAVIQHVYGGSVIDEFTEGAAYRYPASGYLDYADLSSYTTGYFSGGLGSVGFLAADPGSPTGQVHDTNLPLTSAFQVKQTWADDYGTFLRSYHPVPDARDLYAKLGQPYPGGSLEWASTHKFLMFESATWSPWGGAPSTFPGQRGSFAAPTSISLITGTGIDGHAIQVDVRTGWAAVVSTYVLRHQGYRYANLRLRADTRTTLTADAFIGDTTLHVALSRYYQAGDKVTIGAEEVKVSAVGAGTLTVSALTADHASGVTLYATTRRVLFMIAQPYPATGGELAWLATVPGDGTLTSVELDLAVAPYISNSHSFPWNPNSTAYPPAAYMPDPPPPGITPGTPVSVQILDPALWAFDYLEGFYKTSGTRTPLLLFPCLDGRGDQLGITAYEDMSTAAWGVTDPLHGIGGGAYDQADIMRCMVNGQHGFRIAVVTFDASPPPYPVTAYSDIWDHIFDLLDDAANDTGITVIVGSGGVHDDLAAFAALNMGDLVDSFAGSYGLQPTPSVVQNITAQLRTDTPVVAAYYGAGDLTASSGGYAALVTYYIDWVLDGEVIACITGAPDDAPVLELRDNDTEAVFADGSPDDDGMCRLMYHGSGGGRVYAHYGTYRPRSNVPSVLISGFLYPPDEYSGDPPVYTTEGLLLNSDWLHPTHVSEALDSDGYLTWVALFGTERAPYVVLDRYQTIVPLHYAPSIQGTDIAATTPGIHVSALDAGAVVVQTTLDQGATWTSVGITDTPAAAAVPTLAVDRYESLYCFFHTAGGDTHGWRSQDFGASWSAWVTAPAAQHYPRAIMGVERQYLATHDGTQVNIYGSSDFLTTTALLSSPAIATEQLVGFWQDRGGWLHLVYAEGGDVKQQLSMDGVTWRTAVTLRTTAAEPTAADGIPAGTVLLWSGGTLQAQRTASDYEQPDGALIPTGIVVPQQYAGVVSDRRDRLWVAAQSGGVIITKTSGDFAETWV